MQIVFLAVFFFVLYSFASADFGKGNSGNWQYENEYFSISVNGNGNVPKYTFWYTKDPATRYFLRFQQLFEAIWTGNRLKKYGPSNIALPSLTWDWTSVVEDSTNNNNVHQYHFNITTSYPPQFDRLRFVNRIIVSDGNLTGKIDVEIDNYRWVSSDTNAKLVLLFRLSTSDDSKSSEGSQQSDGRVVVRAAWFSIAPSAIALPSNTTIPVTIQVVNNDNGDDGNGIWVIYDHFQGSLRHDPDYGLMLSSYFIFVFGIVAAVCCFIAVVIAAFIMYTIHRRNS